MSRVSDRLKQILGYRVDVGIPVPDNKIGKTLGKEHVLRPPKYFSDSWRELKKVTWPSRKEAWKLTFAVVVFTAVFTVITAVADVGLSKLVEKILL